MWVQLCDQNDYVSREISKDIVQYGNYEDLKEKIEYFLHNAETRERLASLAHTAASEHTFTKRISRLLGMISNRHL